MSFSSEDEGFMRQALDLAIRGGFNVSPNPMVGAVFVKDGKVLSVGYHRKFGGPHAEIEAMNAADEDLSGATLYVTLEPCCFSGKTGACTDALLDLGLERVVVAILDPNHKVSGKGVEILKASGLEVEVGCMEMEARMINQRFGKFMKFGVPYVTVKSAMSLDGKIACVDGSSKWITSEETRAFVHSLRAENEAILVGVGTVLADDPHLGVRHGAGRDPLRVILDSNLKSSLDAQVYRDGDVLVFASNEVDQRKLKNFEGRGVEVFRCEAEVNVVEVLKVLGGRGISSVLVEGGSGVAGSFLEAGAIDRYFACIAPKLIGGSSALSPIGGSGLSPISEVLDFDSIEVRTIGKDVIIEAVKTVY